MPYFLKLDPMLFLLELVYGNDFSEKGGIPFLNENE